MREKLSMAIHSYNPNTFEMKAGGLRVQGQPGLYSKTHCKKKKIVSDIKKLRARVAHTCNP
jgi:hypothetical protein